VIGYGCFLPDLTRFTNLQCGETRQTCGRSRPCAPRQILWYSRPRSEMIIESAAKIHVYGFARENFPG